MERRIKQNVKIEDVVFDETIYPRTKYNWQTGYDYMQSMRIGAKFPPITLASFEGKMILIDGKHRLEAHKLLKLKEIEAEIFVGWDKKKMFEEAIIRNISHGRGLSPYEKRLIVQRLKEQKYSANDISILIQVPMDKLEKFVGNRLSWSTTGEEIILKTEIKNMVGTIIGEVSQVGELQNPMYANNQINILEGLISLIENKLLDLGNPRIAERIEYLKLIL